VNARLLGGLRFGPLILSVQIKRAPEQLGGISENKPMFPASQRHVGNPLGKTDQDLRKQHVLEPNLDGLMDAGIDCAMKSQRNAGVIRMNIAADGSFECSKIDIRIGARDFKIVGDGRFHKVPHACCRLLTYILGVTSADDDLDQ
jgi:hypothetical protein